MHLDAGISQIALLLQPLLSDHDIRTQTAKPLAFAQPQNATMRPGNVGNNRQTQTNATASVLVARGIKAGKRFDRLGPLFRRNARSVIFDPDTDGFGRNRQADFGTITVTNGISDQILNRAPYGHGT